MKRIKDKKPEMQIRAATLEVRAATDDQAASVRMSVSSEEPVLTYGYFNEQYQRFWEVLDHTPQSIDLSRAKDGLVVLDRHYGDQIGLMDVEIDAAARKLGGTVKFAPARVRRRLRRMRPRGCGEMSALATLSIDAVTFLKASAMESRWCGRNRGCRSRRALSRFRRTLRSAWDAPPI